jgi:hypothetical protein
VQLEVVLAVAAGCTAAAAAAVGKIGQRKARCEASRPQVSGMADLQNNSAE